LLERKKKKQNKKLLMLRNRLTQIVTPFSLCFGWFSTLSNSNHCVL